jgi:hypothetical protein
MRLNSFCQSHLFSAVPEFLKSKLCRCGAVFVMLLGVAAVYWSPAIPNTVLMGLDYAGLHSRRMEYAREALFGPDRRLPAWYSRELLGTPFWSNIQNFPFIPTRLLVLLTMESNGPRTYGSAILLSALLAALFTYLYSRQIGLSKSGAAAAGWTFACSGYYASRVAAGHLPLLEAYPSLPLLMWISECLIIAIRQGRSLRPWIAGASTATACVMLAGHPQLSVYAVTAAAMYALWRGGFGRALWMWAAMVLGFGIAAFSLVPMVMLIGRSTRVLALAHPANDLAMPYGRLAAFFFPWRDGVPPLLDPNGVNSFSQYPIAYFWDTVCYVGLVPWISVALLIFCLAGTRPICRTLKIGLFVALLGIAGVVLSLPIVQQATSLIPGTILRSPARIIYLTEFALAIALGTGFHWFASSMWPHFYRVAALTLLLIHIVDLGMHDRRFILRGSLTVPATAAAVITNRLSEVGEGRVAIDYSLNLPMDRTVDDVGFFDSIMLARPYRLILDLSSAPPDLNIQNFNGSEMEPRGLATVGVKFVFTKSKLDNFPTSEQVLGINIYRVPSPGSRAKFFTVDQVQYVSPEEIHSALRDPKVDLDALLLIPRAFRPAGDAVADKNSTITPSVEYRRPNSDHIECAVTTGKGGYLRIIESWDPGWSAIVDGSPAPILPALDSLLAVPISPGRHIVQFVYRTPGAGVGLAISVASVVLLFGLIWTAGSGCRKEINNCDCKTC